jgi:hypothetical protein
MSILYYLHILAINDSSGVGDFLGQISGLLLVTCAAGVIWIGLMALVMQRATERRRRAQLGLEPLPAFHITAYRWIMNAVSPPAAKQPDAPPRSGPARQEPMPAPDLDMLTGDLPQPDLAAMTGHDAPREAPVRVSPSPEPEPPVEEAAPESSPPPEPLYAEDAAPDQPPQGEPPDSVELLRVWRDLTDGALVVEIGGKRFRSLNELRRVDLERRFLNVVRDLDALSTPPRREPSPSSPARDETPPARPQPPPEEAQPTSMGPGAMLRQMRRVAMGQTPEPVEQKPERSIADQIEDLLQARLADMPSFSGREVHVRPSLSGGVQIEVDGQVYDGVGDVDDDEVRDLLAGVVREWEESQ